MQNQNPATARAQATLHSFEVSMFIDKKTLAVGLVGIVLTVPAFAQGNPLTKDISQDYRLLAGAAGGNAGTMQGNPAGTMQGNPSGVPAGQ
jgi:hypothetical protein